MSEIDLAIIVLLALSALLSFLRGFLTEAVSLGSWTAAVVLALVFGPRLAALLPPERFTDPAARSAIATLILFFGCLFVGALIKWLVGRLLAHSRVSLADRLIGTLFGLARGMIVVTLLVLVVDLVPDLKSQPWWQASDLLPRFERAALFIEERLPTDVAALFQPSSTY